MCHKFQASVQAEWHRVGNFEVHASAARCYNVTYESYFRYHSRNFEGTGHWMQVCMHVL